MADELKDSKTNDDGGNAKPLPSNPVPKNTPDATSDASNPTTLKEASQTESAASSPAEPQQSPEEHNLEATQQWKTRGWRAFVWGWKLFGEFVAVLWALALWDSYRPKITITSGPSLDPKDPFATAFIIQNQSALTIRNVSFNSTWIYADSTNQTRNVGINITKIPELGSLEQHALMGILPSSIGTNQLPTPTQIVPTPIEHHSFVYWFDITYDPKFWPRRTTTEYFFGTWDRDGNFEWVPTGHADLRWQSADAVLLKNAINLQEAIQRQRPPSPTNKPARHTNSPANIKTNGSSRVHTK